MSVRNGTPDTAPGAGDQSNTPDMGTHLRISSMILPWCALDSIN
jgi:hypothetical protein